MAQVKDKDAYPIEFNFNLLEITRLLNRIKYEMSKIEANYSESSETKGRFGKETALDALVGELEEAADIMRSRSNMVYNLLEELKHLRDMDIKDVEEETMKRCAENTVTVGRSLTDACINVSGKLFAIQDFLSYMTM